VIVLAGALAAAAGVAVRATLLAGAQSEAVAAAGAAGCAVVLLGGVTGWSAGAPWGVAALAAAYGGALASGPPGLDGWAPAVAAGIVVAGEAGAWAAELQTPLRLDRRIIFRRVGLVLGTAVAAAGAGLALIAPGAGAAVAGPLITAAGVASVVAAVAVIRTLAGRA
jgi:hypothetical protein